MLIELILTSTFVQPIFNDLTLSILSCNYRSGKCEHKQIDIKEISLSPPSVIIGFCYLLTNVLFCQRHCSESVCSKSDDDFLLEMCCLCQKF